MDKLTYTNPSGETAILMNDGVFTDEYLLIKKNIEDMEFLPVNKKGYKQDGETPEYTRALPRHMDFTGYIKANSASEILEAEETLKRIFNPGLHRDGKKGLLRYENDVYTREIDVRVTMQPVFPKDKNQKYAIFVVAMTADDPYFRDVTYTNVGLVGISGGFYWTDPTYFESGTEFYLGELSGASKIMSNNGHKPAPLRIEWTGAAVNPKLTLEDTGEFILIDGTIAAGEKLIITTGYGDQCAYIENISTGVIEKDNSLINPDSIYFQAPIGNSTVSFSAESGTGLVTIKLKQLWM